MSVNRRWLLGSVLLGCGLALAADDVPPDAELLEYLAIWDGSDEEWLIFSEPVETQADRRTDPAPRGEESTETEDEG